MNRSENTNAKLRLTAHIDARGRLIAVEGEKDVPFEIKRTFVISDVPAGAVRGEHAYIRNEFALCVRGSCRVRISDGREETTYALDRPDVGLLIPGMTWRTLFDFSPDCLLFVFSDAHYRTEDFISDRDEFLKRARE